MHPRRVRSRAQFSYPGGADAFVTEQLLGTISPRFPQARVE